MCFPLINVYLRMLHIYNIEQLNVFFLLHPLGELYILATHSPASRRGIVYQIIEPERFENIHVILMLLLIVYICTLRRGSPKD